MKWLSFNYHGLASPKKHLTLRRLLDVHQADVILIHETLGDYDHIIPILALILPSWTLHALDACDHSRGIVIGIDPKALRILNVWVREVVLVADVFSEHIGMELRMVNIYGPCHN